MNKPDDAISADAFAVLLAAMPCWKCGEVTPVAAIWIDEDSSGQTYGAGPALLKYIESINPEAMQQALSLAPWMQMASSATAKRSYLANHCVRCDALQGDYFVHDVDGPFFPQTEEDIGRIDVHAGTGSLRAGAHGSQSSWMKQIKPCLAQILI